MKKLLAIVLAAVMAFGVFAFTGCSDKTGKSDFKVKKAACPAGAGAACG